MKYIINSFNVSIVLLGAAFASLYFLGDKAAVFATFTCGGAFTLALYSLVDMVLHTNPDGSPKRKQREHMRNEILSGTTNDWIAAQRAAFHRDEDIQ
jgi:hypothetical protein